jgi:surface antigen
MPFVRMLRAALAVAPALVMTGCATLNNTEGGALGGAALGGVAGAIAGSAVGRPGAGAAIGAGLGGVSGGLIGNAIDRSEARQAQLAATAPAPRGPLGLTDIAQMAQQHVSDEVIISQIRNTGSVFENLSASDIVWLKQNGVSDNVILAMQSTRPRPIRRVYAPAPVYAVPVYEPVYVAPPPPPPPHLHIGFGYVGGRCR